MTALSGSAVVTGGGSGIGAALCAELAARGMRVVVADRDGASADAVAARIGGRSALVDVTDAAAVQTLADDVWARDGAIDLWINNAGVAVGGTTDALGLDDWRRVLDVNLSGVVHGVHAVYPRMAARRRGWLANIASVAGLAPYPFALPYTASKHAVVGLSLALRAEARAVGVRVSVACPGMIGTPIWERSPVRGPLADQRQRVARMPKLSAERCAAAIVRGIAADRAVIPVTAEAHVAWRLARLSPALAVWAAGRLASFARRGS